MSHNIVTRKKGSLETLNSLLSTFCFARLFHLDVESTRHVTTRVHYSRTKMAEPQDFIVGDDCVAILEAIEQDLLEQDAEFSFHITEEVAEVSETLKATFIDILNRKHLALSMALA